MPAGGVTLTRSRAGCRRAGGGAGPHTHKLRLIVSQELLQKDGQQAGSSRWFGWQVAQWKERSGIAGEAYIGCTRGTSSSRTAEPQWHRTLASSSAGASSRNSERVMPLTSLGSAYLEPARRQQAAGRPFVGQTKQPGGVKHQAETAAVLKERAHGIGRRTTSELHPPERADADRPSEARAE